MCQPESAVVCWTSDVFDINRQTTGMIDQKGWDLNVLQFPAAIHIAVTMAHTKEGVVEAFLKDLAEVTAPLMASPKVKAAGGAAVYGMSQAIPDRSVVGECVATYIDVMLQADVDDDD
jgi:sphinganine-1-phosphate aldolase